jgi:flagellar protein FlaG
MSISSVSFREVSSPSESIREAPKASTPPLRQLKPQESADISRSPETVASPEKISAAIKQVNEVLAAKGQNLYAALETDKATGINVVKFLDKNTKEVISQFPSKEILAIAEVLGKSQEDKGQLLYVSG